MSHDQLLGLLGQLLLVLGLARLFGELARRLHQPPMVGEILAGLVLGQTILGQLFPDVFFYDKSVPAVRMGRENIVSDVWFLPIKVEQNGLERSLTPVYIMVQAL